LDLLRLTAPEPPDGVSLVPLLDPGGTLLPLTAVVESVAGPAWLGRPRDRALRDGGWKWIESGRDELYDLRRDPGETRDLSAAIPARAREMRAALGAALHGGAVPDQPPVAAEAALLADGLAALRTADGARARTALEELRRRLAAQGHTAPAGLLALIGGSLRLQHRPADALPLYEEALAASAAPEAAVDAAAGTATPDGTAPGSFVGMLHAEIGACRRLAGQGAAALESYRAAVTLRPDDPWDRLALADLLVDSGDPEAAIDELRAALLRAPGEGDLLASLGRAYLAAEQPSAAILPLQDALRAAPGLTRPWFDLGRAYEGLGRSADALRAYQDFTARVPEPGDPLFQQAAERMKALRPGA
ncbi:MAG TPA: tetratricopeptide repeat protein, partial [Dongiaceae bacterium]|nr:tetratricopeptide repeat protein [Dongiaceae bacterium]